MAQKVEIRTIDDLDGITPADRTVTFGLHGRHYEIDLTTAHATELRETLRPFIKAGRATGRDTPEDESKRIRQWAKDNGYAVSTRGRLHLDVVKAYRNAMHEDPA